VEEEMNPKRKGERRRRRSEGTIHCIFASKTWLATSDSAAAAAACHRGPWTQRKLKERKQLENAKNERKL